MLSQNSNQIISLICFTSSTSDSFLALFNMEILQKSPLLTFGIDSGGWFVTVGYQASESSSLPTTFPRGKFSSEGVL